MNKETLFTFQHLIFKTKIFLLVFKNGLFMWGGLGVVHFTFFCKATRDHWDYPFWAFALHAAKRKGGTLCSWAIKAFMCLRIDEWEAGRCRHHISGGKRSSKTILLLGKTKACLVARPTSYSLTKNLPTFIIHLHLLLLLSSPFLGTHLGWFFAETRTSDTCFSCGCF